MDEADVLGDRLVASDYLCIYIRVFNLHLCLQRIAIVKEGRMRAIGSARFLKNRFGMGYLLRTSLKQNANANNVVTCVLDFVRDGSVVSTAGTECAIRLPKEAVTYFPALFEYIDSHLFELGVVNYGIETTTLEEVFMRIVNEDTDLLLADAAAASKLLGASGAERDAQQKVIRDKDEKKYPLNEADIKLLLVQGNQGGRESMDRIYLQTQILVMKRFFQFFRSKGQWMMVVVVPIGMIIISAIIMAAIPTSIIGEEPQITSTAYDSVFATPVAGLDETSTLDLAANAGVANPIYVGSNYSDLYSFVYENDVVSAAAVSYSSPYNATIMYNSTFPIWYPGLISGVFQTALNEATGGRLQVNAIAHPLAPQVLSEQVCCISA